MTVGNVATHHDAASSEQACDSVGSEASTASNQMDSVETAAISQQLDLSSISNYLSQSRSLQNAELQPGELEIVHQQLAVQALKRGDFKAVAQITAWMAQNQQRKTNLLPPLSKEEYALSSTADSPTLSTPVKGDGAGFQPATATTESARFVDTATAVQGSFSTLNETRNRKDKKSLGDLRQSSPKVKIGSQPDSETPSPPSAGSDEGAGATSETRKALVPHPPPLESKPRPGSPTPGLDSATQSTIRPKRPGRRPASASSSRYEGVSSLPMPMPSAPRERQRKNSDHSCGSSHRPPLSPVVTAATAGAADGSELFSSIDAGLLISPVPLSSRDSGRARHLGGASESSGPRRSLKSAPSPCADLDSNGQDVPPAPEAASDSPHVSAGAEPAEARKSVRSDPELMHMPAGDATGGARGDPEVGHARPPAVDKYRHDALNQDSAAPSDEEDSSADVAAQLRVGNAAHEQGWGGAGGAAHAHAIDDLFFAEAEQDEAVTAVVARRGEERADGGGGDAHGVTFPGLLVSTFEADAANEREARGLDRHGRDAELRDQAARMKWRKENYVRRSLLCLPLDARLRRACCAVLEWRWFDRIILAVIAANCVFMAMEDPPNRLEESAYNALLYNAGIFFQTCFMLEAAAKIVARGFVLGRGAYLRDWWNVLDFVTVVLGLVEYLVVAGASASVLRTFRLVRPLRALRAVGRFKDLRMIVNLIISCLPLLVDVFALISFVFMVFGIIGIQLWGGYLRGRCYDMDSGRLDQANIDTVCTMEGDGGMGKCVASEQCLRIYMNPVYDSLTFDYIGSVLIIIFQIMVQQKWNEIMYYVWDSFSFWSWPYFVLLNLVGPMFAVQLFLVVVANQYSNARAQQREAEKAAVELYEVKVGAVTANLPRTSHTGHHLSFDPYVVISVDEKTKKTRIVKNSSVPEWNEYFLFPVSSAASTAKIDIRSWRRQGPHDTIGHLSIPVGTLDQEEEGTDRWYEVCSPDGASMEGSIRIRTQWRLVSSEEWSPLPEIDDEDMPEEEDAEDDDVTFIKWLQSMLRLVAESKFLTVTSILFICGNMLAMAADHDCDLVEDAYCKNFEAQLEQANIVFTSFFVLELIIKVWGLGLVSYFKDVSNAFDFFIVLISLVELPSSVSQIRCYLLSPPEEMDKCDNSGGSMSALRTFRLVRILRLGKLVELFPQIRRQIKVITRTLGAVSSLVVLILMYLIIFAILGMSMLGGNAVEYLRTTDPDNINGFRPGNSVRVLIPTDPYMILTATILKYDPTRPDRPYLVYRNEPSNNDWPINHMSNESLHIWRQNGEIWLNMLELEPFQYHEYLSMRHETTIVGLVPRGNFDSFYMSAITVFQIFTTSDLGDVMYPAIRGSGMFASLFFAVQVMLGNLLLFNLFTGIIITGFSETKEELQKEEQENQRMIEQDKLRRAQSLARGLSIGSKARSSNGTSISRGMSITSSVAGIDHCSSLETAVEKVKALMLGTNRVTAEDLRRSAAGPGSSTEKAEEVPKSTVYHVVTNRYFEGIIMLSILLSSLALSIQRPNMTDIEHDMSKIVDILVGIIFLIECILKIIGLGFYRYIGSRWNQLDFFLVLTTVIDLLLTWFAKGPKVGFFSTLKIVRSLRPLRIISRMKKLKDTFSTITRAFVPVMNTIAIAMCVFFIFGIMAVQLLGGQMHYCTDEFEMDKINCTGTNLFTNQTRDWESRRIKYDWIGDALLSMFILASQDNWEYSMFAAIDSTGKKTGPYVNSNPIISLYFIAFMIVGSFFVIQLFVGVFIDTFQTVVAERKALSRQSSLSSETTDVSASANFQEPSGVWRLMVFDVVTQKQFDILIAVYIVLNILVMASEAYKLSSVQAKFIKTADFVFNFVFGSEMICKIFGLRAKYYYSSSWNIFDYSVVMLSYCGIAMDLFGAVISLNPTIIRSLRIFRIFRILRAFRIFRAAQGLQNLIRTLGRSLKEVSNLGMLLLLLFFITSVMVVEAFGRLCVDSYDPSPIPGKWDRCILLDPRALLDRHATFTNSGIALLSLFRIATGDDWSNIMGSTSMEAGIRPSGSNATAKALDFMLRYNTSLDPRLLEMARRALPVCQTSEELASLSAIISCEEEDFLGYCPSTCGSYLLSSLVFTVFLCVSQFVLLNLVMGVLMRELSAAITSAQRKTDSQTSASISVLLSVNAATNNWLRRASLSSTGTGFMAAGLGGGGPESADPNLPTGKLAIPGPGTA